MKRRARKIELLEGFTWGERCRRMEPTTQRLTQAGQSTLWSPVRLGCAKTSPWEMPRRRGRSAVHGRADDVDQTAAGAANVEDESDQLVIVVVTAMRMTPVERHRWPSPFQTSLQYTTASVIRFWARFIIIIIYFAQQYKTAVTNNNSQRAGQ